MKATNQIAVWVEDSWADLQNLVPSHINRDRFKRNMLDFVRFNEEAQRCEPKRLFRELVRAANLGLELGVLGSAHIVRFKDRAQLIIGYQGMIDLARRSGALKSIHAIVVHENDSVVQLGDGSIIYEGRPFKKDRGPIVGAMVTCLLEDNVKQWTTMTLEEYEGTRPAYWEKTPHKTHMPEMLKKACIRRALKYVPMTPEFSKQVKAIDQLEEGVTWEKAEFEDKTEAEPKSLSDSLALAEYRMKEDQVASTAESIKEAARRMMEEEKPQEEKAKSTRAEPPISWDRHLYHAQNLSRKIGLPVWQKLTEPRQALLKRRCNAEGFKASEADEFWEHANGVFGNLPGDYFDRWPDSATLDVLLRIPRTGGVDHFQKVSEGTYERPEAQDEDLPSSAMQELMTLGEEDPF